MTACFRWVLKEGGEGQENENRNSNAEVGQFGIWVKSRFARRADLARELASRTAAYNYTTAKIKNFAEDT